MKKTLLTVSLLALLLAGCDSLEDSRTQVETQYLDQHQELKQAVELIRAQGIESVRATADAGSVAACVAKNLDADPVGALIQVEGVLQDSVNLDQLLTTMSSLSDQKMGLDRLPDLLQQSTDTLRYVKTMLEEYELQELKTQAIKMLEQGQTKTENVGEHLRQLIETCQTK
ncbi:hypothetical protein ACSLBF_04600 [Pseudoalteromonas sp. T1lg65]|uniref:hypothetical protein n=1 Tax=Pseudoalteromonas sp. T1lg65 TaxID=2077101 RepID=UPI003F794F9C